jgi:hypothetical protein
MYLYGPCQGRFFRNTRHRAMIADKVQVSGRQETLERMSRLVTKDNRILLHQTTCRVVPRN